MNERNIESAQLFLAFYRVVVVVVFYVVVLTNFLKFLIIFRYVAVVIVVVVWVFVCVCGFF